MHWRVRDTLCDGIWIDLKFVDCQTVILLELCKRFKIECALLDRYVNDRETMLNDMIASGVNSRDKANEMLIAALNGGFRTVNTTWWEAFRTECKSIAKKLAKNVKHKAILQESTTESGVNNNLHFIVTNEVVRNYENMCLELLFDVLKDTGCIDNSMCCLMFDGLMVADNQSNRAKLTPEFFKDTSEKISKALGFRLDIKIKLFDGAYPISKENLASVTEGLVLDYGKESDGVDEFDRIHGKRLINYKGTMYWERGGIYTPDVRLVRNGVCAAIISLKMQMRTLKGLVPYTDTGKNIDTMFKMITQDPRFEDDRFDEKLATSYRHLAFEDGIYSYKTKKLLPYPVQDIYFTIKMNDPFPKDCDPDALRQVYCVLDSIFPDVALRDHWIACVARAMAGEVGDKTWFANIGERDSGKGVLVDWLHYCFGPFIGTCNAESLLCTKNQSQDAAKALSWVHPLQFTRLACSNEFRTTGANLDGNMIKLIASGGDKMSIRRNYVDEYVVKIQCTLMLFCEIKTIK